MTSESRKKLLALTSAFETGTMPPHCYSIASGNFDGQGISFGALQYNLGQGTLQPIISSVYKSDPRGFAKAFSGGKDQTITELLQKPRSAQVAWAASITSGRKLIPGWAEAFKRFGQLPACQNAQVQGALPYFTRAEEYCRQYRLRSERAYALMFDIAVQNGSIKRSVAQQINNQLSYIDSISDPKTREWELMKYVANTVAEASNSRWVEDVRKRKLCIANGVGVVHGRKYNLERDFNITMTPVF